MERFNFIAAQRAPLSVVTGFILSDVSNAEPTTITLNCGHSFYSAAHFSHKIGERLRCIECGKIIAASLPEFLK